MELAIFYIILAALFALFMAWGIGANDVANAMAPSVGSKAITIKQAIIIATVALCGCSTMYPGISDGRQIVSSGAVGCPPAEVVISNSGQHSWTATCRGQVFHCSATPDVRCAAAR